MKRTPRFPPWIKRPVAAQGTKRLTEEYLADGSLPTVCEEATCPNRGECFARGNATFLIMGTRCTRDCRFCGILHGVPEPVDIEEPQRVARAVARMGISHAVITSVTRDDIPDGGAGHFARTVRAVRDRAPGVSVEVLIPDFNGSIRALHRVLESGPDVCNHNIETVSRLYPAARPGAGYERSLALLSAASRSFPECIPKSGMMVGLGEKEKEVVALMKDLRGCGCRVLTIGQYLPPSPEHLPVHEYIHPDRFKRYEQIGRELGFDHVFSGPFVRSSYRAEEVLYKEIRSQKSVVSRKKNRGEEPWTFE